MDDTRTLREAVTEAETALRAPVPARGLAKDEREIATSDLLRFTLAYTAPPTMGTLAYDMLTLDREVRRILAQVEDDGTLGRAIERPRRHPVRVARGAVVKGSREGSFLFDALQAAEPAWDLLAHSLPSFFASVAEAVNSYKQVAGWGARLLNSDGEVIEELEGGPLPEQGSDGFGPELPALIQAASKAGGNQALDTIEITRGDFTFVMRFK